MKILVTGGGSGGHITPILAVAHELKALRPNAQIVYVGQIGDQLSDVPAQDPNIDAVHNVWAGKFRRYANESIVHQLLDVRSQALNVRDVWRILRGTWQSYWLVRKLKPDVIFTRGGFVSVPVAIGGKLNGVPYVTHDSDSVPSLANRIIARWAAAHAVAMPAELYPYPAAKTTVVGVPVNKAYQSITTELRRQYRQQIGIPDQAQLLFVTGGGNGARVFNQALPVNVRYLLGTYPDLHIIHLSGRTMEHQTNAAYNELNLGSARRRVQVYGFVSGVAAYSGAADIVMTRGGATTLAEFAIQGVACVIVPSEQLGWNVKNARVLARQRAALELTEAQLEQPERLGRTIGELLDDAPRRAQLAHNLAQYAHPHAAAELAALVLQIGGEGHVQEKS